MTKALLMLQGQAFVAEIAGFVENGLLTGGVRESGKKKKKSYLVRAVGRRYHVFLVGENVAGLSAARKA